MLPMFEITSGRVVEKYTTHISLKKHLASYQKVFNAKASAVSYSVWNITYMDVIVDLLALFHISNGLATFFMFVKMYACLTM